jgi:epoxyqueuosine reductase
MASMIHATDAPGFERFCKWLDRGYAGTMGWLGKRQAAYRHPSGVMENVRSLLVLGMPYQPAPCRRSSTTSADSNVGFGKTAAYTSGDLDYHDIIHQRIKAMIERMRARVPALKARGVVDSAPLLERDFGFLAGLGWIGKNTMLINRKRGSYFFLAAILFDHEWDSIELPSIETDHCGTCTACLDACPTGAFPEARVLDARRCISYLTIEHRGIISDELSRSMGDWLFGCDICQQVCPWNRFAEPTLEDGLRFEAGEDRFDLIALLSIDDDAFRKKFRKTPFWRAKRVGLIRNALIVLGNQGDEKAVDTVIPFLRDPDATLRATAARALGQLGGSKAQQALTVALEQEISSDVQDSIRHALDRTRLCS